MNKEEHYKNNPNDYELTKFGKKLISIIGKLRHNRKVTGIKRNITIMVLKSQIKADAQIKNIFIDMFPEEYKKALQTTKDKYGATPKRSLRREEIIQSMNLKNRNILREKR